jgi:hypothetical protein
MRTKYKHDSETGMSKQSLVQVILGGMLFFTVLALCAILEPTYLKYYLYLSIPSGVIGLLSLIWLRTSPNLYARFFLNTSISVLCLIISFRSIDDLLPHYSQYAAILIVILVTWAHTLPMWNPSLTKFIRDELSSPKTKIGRIIFRASLVLVPIIGVLTYAIVSISIREKKSIGISIILAISGLLFAMILPFAYRLPSSPWEEKKI